MSLWLWVLGPLLVAWIAGMLAVLVVAAVVGVVAERLRAWAGRRALAPGAQTVGARNEGSTGGPSAW